MFTMKFKAGDKVKIKSDLRVWDIYDTMTIMQDMVKYFGREMIIKSVNEFKGQYTMEGTDSPWVWSEQCFDAIEEVQASTPVKKVADTRLKVGDKITVRKDLEEDKRYGHDSFVGSMLNLKGKVCTISELWGSEKYHLEEDEQNWSWTSEMFEKEQNPEVKQEPVEVKPNILVKNFIYAKTKQLFEEFNVTTKETRKDCFFIPERNQRVIWSGNTTIVILDDGTKGVAKCMPEDNQDNLKGLKIAYTRAKIKLLQKELKNLVK